MYNTLEEAMRGGGRLRRGKYGVAPAADRRWRGRTYDSKAEMLYAQTLHAGGMYEVVEQPAVRLGEDTVYRPDFLVIDLATVQAWYVDVKGVETREFRRVRRLWEKYARLPLHIVRRGSTAEIIVPREVG